MTLEFYIYMYKFTFIIYFELKAYIISDLTWKMHVITGVNGVSHLTICDRIT